MLDDGLWRSRCDIRSHLAKGFTRQSLVCLVADKVAYVAFVILGADGLSKCSGKKTVEYFTHFFGMGVKWLILLFVKYFQAGASSWIFVLHQMSPGVNICLSVHSFRIMLEKVRSKYRANAE